RHLQLQRVSGVPAVVLLHAGVVEEDQGLVPGRLRGRGSTLQCWARDGGRGHAGAKHVAGGGGDAVVADHLNVVVGRVRVGVQGHLLPLVAAVSTDIPQGTDIDFCPEVTERTFVGACARGQVRREAGGADGGDVGQVAGRPGGDGGLRR